MAARMLVAISLVGVTACAHTVRVRTDPPGAQVTVNGKNVGTTPLEFEDSGDPEVREHVIAARLNGYETLEIRVQRRQANPWALISAAPLCGTVAWPVALVPVIGGVALTPVTCGASLIAGPTLGAIIAGAGCVWIVATSPTLLMLQQAQTLPDEIAMQLKPGGTFDQHDEGLTWPPTFFVPPDADNYWQNPAPPVDSGAQSLPSAGEDDSDERAQPLPLGPAPGQAF
ncbi:MAG: PEGA domain-containing protein [Pseudomonadota bacterium]